MPNETVQAIEWALNQYMVVDDERIYVTENGEINSSLLVDFVRNYYNENNIDYDTFSFADLKPYLS